MGELIDLQAVERWFGILAVSHRFSGSRSAPHSSSAAVEPGALVTGVLIGLLGPANWLLWHIYNRIEDHYGLDSVKAMLINLALFAVLGIAVGLAFRFTRRSQPQSSRPEHLNT